MKSIYEVETILLILISGLSSILLYNLIYKLRSILAWRVNCWFCNGNVWVQFMQRNSWNCPKCEQYNGFTKDGDYNRPLFSNPERNTKSPNVFRKTLPKNGLCRMCNINQQLKVAQLANYVPMNERNYEAEIESYRQQLEKVYKLCSPCRKVLQLKLHKEKETLLGFKLIETRTETKVHRKDKQNKIIKMFINNTSMLIAGFIIVLVTVECYKNLHTHKNIYSTVQYLKEIFLNFTERIIMIVKLKILNTFPSSENYLTFFNDILYSDNMTKISDLTKELNQYNEISQKVLGCLVCILQILGHIWNINKLKYTIAVDLLWTVFITMTIAHQYVAVKPLIISLVKVTSIVAVFLIYRNMNTKTSIRSPKKYSPKGLMKIHNKSKNSSIDEEDSSLETDDDVSLSKFGIHNLTESSNDTASSLNNTVMSGRTFTPRTNDSIWTKPKLNSTFCVNSVISKSPSSVSDTIFAKPSFNKYEKLAKDDSDSELDESISSLYIGSPKKPPKGNSLFTLRKFTATPNFVTPTPMTRSRPLISPSKLGHSTSWVAGGYWGSEGERQIFSVDGSRSSSQSSGFESQASSNQRNIFSHPPSREESVCGEDRNSMLDGFQSCNGSSYHTQNFSRINSPVFPQMKFNSHVQIPQPRLASSMSSRIFAQHYDPKASFKPAGSSLIKLPQVNSFSSH